jgi:predicted permease
MWRDVRYAAQALVRAPAFTLTATLALGLAIGANATIFGLVDALWFRPPGVGNPARLVRIFSTTTTEREGLWSYPEYLDLRDKTSGFDGVVARGRRGAILLGPGGREELTLVNVVTLDFFTALGVTAAHGRLFAPGDASLLESAPGVVLGHAFWRSRFGADPAIVGRTIDLARGGPVPVVVLGVLPQSFRDLDAAADRDLWLPPQTWARLAGRDEFLQRDARWFDVIGLRRPGVTGKTLQAEVATLAGALAQAYPAVSAGRGARVISDLGYRFESGGVNALALLGLVLLVVVITCVNIANLLLARAVARGRELAVRVALGAGRGRLLRQLMTENVLLGALGAVAGLTIAMWLIRLLPAILLEPPGFRSFLVFETDVRLIAFTLAVTGVTTVLFGVVPSFMASRADVAPLIKEGAAAGFRRQGLFRQGLVIGQIAVSLVLLCAAGVLARSFVETRRADIGFARKPLLAVWATTGDLPQATAMEAVRRLEALPGVAAVAVALRAPLSLSGGGLARPVFLPHQPATRGDGLPEVKFNAVSVNYFEVFGTRIIRGRGFGADDQRAGEPVLIVNQRFADQFFPGADALGRVVRLQSATGVEHRIIGIAQNAVINRIGEEPEPYMYLPFWRGQYGETTFVVDAASDPAALAAAARNVLRRTDPRLEPRRTITMGQYIEYSAASYRATAVLAVALGFVGLLLTALGVYGVVAYRTTTRTKEFGIRVALGAARGQVLTLILRESLRVAGIGLALGFPAALLTTHVMRSLLFGVAPWDAPIFAGAGAVLLAAVCAATVLPAWRAAAVDPAHVLRGM